MSPRAVAPPPPQLVEPCAGELEVGSVVHVAQELPHRLGVGYLAPIAAGAAVQILYIGGGSGGGSHAAAEPGRKEASSGAAGEEEGWLYARVADGRGRTIDAVAAVPGLRGPPLEGWLHESAVAPGGFERSLASGWLGYFVYGVRTLSIAAQGGDPAASAEPKIAESGGKAGCRIDPTKATSAPPGDAVLAVSDYKWKIFSAFEGINGHAEKGTGPSPTEASGDVEGARASPKGIVVKADAAKASPTGAVGVIDGVRSSPTAARRRRAACAASNPAAPVSLRRAAAAAEAVGLELLGAGAPGAWHYPLREQERRSFVGYLQSRFSAEAQLAMLRKVMDGMDAVGWDHPEGPLARMSRGTKWMVASGCRCPYRYGGVMVSPTRFPQWMVEIMQVCMPLCGLEDESLWPNCCNLNCYADGTDGLDWHSDDEPIFGPMDVRIISLSLCQKGGERHFEFRHKGQEACCLRLQLNGGDLCTMEGLTQRWFEHRVPKGGKSQRLRANLTWRWIVVHDQRRCAKAAW